MVRCKLFAQVKKFVRSKICPQPCKRRLNLLHFWRPRCRHRRLCLNSLCRRPTVVCSFSITCWIFCVCLTAIQTSKEHEVDEGFADVIEKGWLIKEGANDDSRRKRQVINFRHINPVITPQKQNILSSQPCLRTLLQTRLLANQSLRTMLDISYREVTQLLVNQQFSLWPTRVRISTGRRQTSLLFTSVTARS